MNEVPLKVRAAAELELRRRRKVNTADGVIWKPDPRNKPQCLAYELAISGQVMEIGYGGQAGGGKALSIYAIIPTPNGYKQMGELLVGDEVFGMDGCIYKIVGTSNVMRNHRVFDVVFDDGTIIRADADHKWRTFTDKERDAIRQRNNRERRRTSRPLRGTGKRPDLARRNSESADKHISAAVTGADRTTLEIKETLFADNKGRINHAIRMAQPLELPERSLPINPYILGFWIGDGNSRGGRVTIGDKYIEEAQTLFENQGYTLRSHSNSITYGVPYLQKQLRESGLLKNKHIPEEYLFASFEQRQALLQGLMDTDGYAAPNGTCEFYTSKVSLAESVSRLLHTLGIKHAIRTKKPPKNTNYNESYRIHFVAPFPVFRLSFKLSRQSTTLRETQKWRYIVDVREVDSEPVKCIAIDSPDHLYLAGEECVPTHNSDLLLGLAATHFRKSRIMRAEFPQLDAMIERGDLLFPSRFIGGHKKRWLFNGRSIALRSMPNPNDWKKYQGQPVEFLGIDEAAEFPEAPIRNVTGWLRSAEGIKTLVVYTTNPPTTPEGDWIIRTFAPWIDPQHPNPAEDGEIRWFAHIKDKSGSDIIRELTHGEPFVDEVSGRTIYPISRTFIHASRYDNPYLDEEYERRLQNLDEPLRTILMDGDFTVGMQDDLWQVIPTNWVLAAQERWRKTPKPDVALRAIGVDVAHGGADDSVIMKLYGVWFDNPLVYPGTSTPDGSTLAKLVENAWDGKAPIAVDAVGYGASATHIMQLNDLKPIPINFGAGSARRDKTGRFQFFNQRAECWWAFRDALDPASGENICLPPSRKLRADLCAPRYKQVRGKIQLEEKVKIKERLGRSPDEGDTAVLTWRAAQRMLAPIVLDW